MKNYSVFLLCLMLVSPAAAQDEHPSTDAAMSGVENLQTPADWIVRTDSQMPDVVIGSDQETADIWFVNMAPGWHITTGPAAIFYRPTATAEGEYTAQSTIHLFDPGDRREAFGLLFGGRDLETDEWTYDYFLIRNSGEFLIKRRQGAETSTLVEWTPHEAVRTFGPDTESSVANTLSVSVGADDVVFFLNGEEATRLPRTDAQTDGIVGLRINHALNVHLEDLTIVGQDD